MKTPLQSELEQRIGRNLLRYQLVELRLKQALPMRRVTLSAEGMSEIKKALGALEHRTLGVLGKELAEAIEFSPAGGREAFVTAIRQFIDARNWLVHHLLRDSGLLLSDESAQMCIARLDMDYLAAEQVARQVMMLHRFILQSIQIFADEWVSHVPATATEMHKLRMKVASRLAAISDGTLAVQLEVPVLEILTDAMDSLERAQRRDDGWVIFNVIGNKIRQDFGRPPPRLLRLAQRVPGYEFSVREVKAGGGTTWMFRRAPLEQGQNEI